MSQSTMNSSAPAVPVAAYGSDEYVMALGLRSGATLEEFQAACEASEHIEKQYEKVLAAEEKAQQEALAAEEAAAKAGAEQMKADEEAFLADRMNAAGELSQLGETGVATALRGYVAPVWAKQQIQLFLGRFLPKGRRGRFHDILEETLAIIEEVIIHETKEVAEAERIRVEAKRRQAKNRADRAMRQSRGDKKSKK